MNLFILVCPGGVTCLIFSVAFFFFFWGGGGGVLKQRCLQVLENSKYTKGSNRTFFILFIFYYLISTVKQPIEKEVKIASERDKESDSGRRKGGSDSV